MVKLFRYLKKREWIMAAVSLVFIISQVWLDLRLPEYMSEITVLVQTDGSTMSEILTAGGKMLGCALGSMAMAIITCYFASVIAASVSKRLQSELYHKVLSFSSEEMNHFSTASLITRSTNDVTQVQMIFAMGMQLMIKAPIMAVMAIIKIQNKGNWQWTTLTAGAVILLLTVITLLMSYALPKFRKMQSLTDNLNRITRENLTGLRVVRAYNAENYQESKFTAANDEMTTNSLRVNRAMSIINPVMSLVMNGISLGIYWIGAYLIESAGMQEKLDIFSNMVVFSSYSMQVIMSFMMLAMIFVMLPRAQVSAKRILEVLQTAPTLKNGSRDSENNLEGEIEFDHVSFRYPGADADMLEDITFTAHKGETIAFIGATGSGKTTLVNLIPRLYDVSKGSVKVDGVDVREYDMKKLRNKLGYVSQKAVLFAGDIRENIRLGDNGKQQASDDEIRTALDIAQSSDFVGNIPEGIGGEVSQNGANFSGGQKQRLSIARAIARKPEIYIFDDSFSALDYKTDRILRSRLKQESAGVTTLIVAQRIGTIMDADKIIVLDDGRAVGIGTHKQLLETCPVYQQIAASQLSKEELSR
ncbi:MAG TPA: ABC transporter ATP-binding protein [Candidatus Faecivivens stercoripullorum]|uniref:ABC transporter ATP-binding protein n=1 Tax=Candidatus Faecivivens stercoripullorum TaxID=2840805 RepID=A0A9D1H6V8_9FIRM|nr:ABC transporter ATP-binding protein [Candidatus Faecivivens stercoripullorum]